MQKDNEPNEYEISKKMGAPMYPQFDIRALMAAASIVPLAAPQAAIRELQSVRKPNKKGFAEVNCGCLTF